MVLLVERIGDTAGADIVDDPAVEAPASPSRRSSFSVSDSSLAQGYPTGLYSSAPRFKSEV